MENVKVQDYVIPKGAIVLPSLFHVMHNPEYFKNPEIFNPNRSSLFDFSKEVFSFSHKLTYALSICPDKIFFVQDKIRFVLDKILSMA